MTTTSARLRRLDANVWPMFVACLLAAPGCTGVTSPPADSGGQADGDDVGGDGTGVADAAGADGVGDGAGGGTDAADAMGTDATVDAAGDDGEVSADTAQTDAADADPTDAADAVDASTTDDAATGTDAGQAPCDSAATCPEPLSTCHVASCDGGVCGQKALPDGASCQGTSLCVEAGVCQAGICQATKTKSCDDGNICTKDACTVESGLCAHTPQFDNIACSDGSSCSVGALCLKGACNASATKDCDDGEVCTKDACDPKTGTCIALPGAATASCDDGNPCTAGDSCDADGNCVAGAASCSCATSADCEAKSDGDKCKGTLYCDQLSKQCKLNLASIPTCQDDADPCTTVACDPKTGACLPKPAAAATPCDDANPCTVGDICNGLGACKSGTAVCACQSDGDCKAQEDGDTCNGTLFCDKTGGLAVCKVNPATVVFCPPQKDTACVKNQCNAKTGQCQLTEVANKAPCDDGELCTVGDACLAGACKPGTDTCSCSTNAQCLGQEDGNLCNGTLFCNKATGQCDMNPATIVVCPTVNDSYCSKTLCQPKTGQCVVEASHEGQACDDGDDACTSDETCQKGTCVSANNTCLCSSDADCQDDGDLCNGLTYCNKAQKKCAVNPATAVICPSVDDTICAANQCQPKTGKCAMTARNQGLGCDADGDNCTPNDACVGGVCVADKSQCQCKADADCAAYSKDDLCADYYCEPLSKQCKVNPATLPFCSPQDDTACAVHACDGKTGKCAMKPVNEKAACDADGSSCTVGDACSAGACKPGPSSCQCVNDSDCAPLASANKCVGQLKCNGATGSCQIDAATAVLCNKDGDTACVENRCDAADGTCKMTPVNEKSPCGKGTLCQGVPLCAKGSCGKGAVVDCDDGNPCTTDSCDDYKGCVHVAATGETCDDGNACTEKDVCVKGACTGVKVSCDGGTPCTTDYCHPLEGCKYVATPGACDDGDACTGEGNCVGASCVAAKIDCDDGKGCTDDACDKQKGCTHIANTAPCDDGNACTKGDACGPAGCAGKPLELAVDCDDGNPCTAPGCQAAVGCVQTKLHSEGKNQIACDDGNWCNVARCTSGVCKAHAPRCTADKVGGCAVAVCDGKAKVCSTVKLKIGDSCDDGDVCSSASACDAANSCVGTAQVACDDGNPCTTDGCDKFSGCTFAPHSKACNDGDACTVGEVCGSSLCQGGKPIACDDDQPCTADSCDKQKGCVFAAIDEGKACGDAAECQTEGVCQKGLCVGAVARPWDRSGLAPFGACGDLESGDASTGDAGEWFVYGRLADAAGMQQPAFGRVNFAGKLRTSTLVPTAKGGMLWGGVRGAAGVVAVGHVTDGAGATDGLFVRTADEATVTTALSFGGSKAEVFRGVVALGDGGHLIVGSNASKAVGGRDGWIVRLDKADKLAWDKVLGTVVDDALLAVAATDDGLFTAVGEVGDHAGWIVRVQADGALVKDAVEGDAADKRRYRVVRALAGGASLVGDTGLRVFDKDGVQTAAHALPAGLGFVDDLRPRAGGGWAVAAGGTALLLDATFAVQTSLPAAPSSGSVDGVAVGRRIVPVGADSFVSLGQSGCALRHPDNFGNLSCEASGACFTKAKKDCADDSLCTKNETCSQGKCVSTPTLSQPCPDKDPCQTNAGCDPKTGACAYPAKAEGSACSNAGGACAIFGTCTAQGVCVNDGLAAWSNTHTVFWGCCGEAGYDSGQNQRRDYQEGSFRALAVHDDGTLTAVGEGRVGLVGSTSVSYKTNSIYGHSFAKNGALGTRYAWNEVVANCNTNKNHIPSGTGDKADWYLAVEASSLADRSAAVLAYVPDVAGLVGTPDCNGNCKVNGKTGQCVGAPDPTPNGKKAAIRRFGGNGKMSEVKLGGLLTTPTALSATDDRLQLLALCADHEGDDSTKLKEFSVYRVQTNASGGATDKVLSNHRQRFGELDEPAGIDALGDGGFVACGRTMKKDPATNAEVAYSAIARFGAAGDLAWQDVAASADELQVFGCGAIAGGFVVAGNKRKTVAGTTVNLVWARRVDGDGHLQWDEVYRPNAVSTFGRDVLAVGDAIVLGGELGGKAALLRLDAAGNDLGDKTFANAVRRWQRMPDGGFAGAGEAGGKPYVVRTDAFGNFPCEAVGNCLGKAYKDCDDGNACTVDACSADAGCTQIALDDGKPCDDGDVCTGDGGCSQKVCKAGAALPQGTFCDDGKPCTTAGACGAAAVCVHSATCDDGKPCTTDSCDAKTGACGHQATAAGGACDDGDFCTEKTTCDASGACQGGAPLCETKVIASQPFDCGATGFDGAADANGVRWAVDGTPSSPAAHSGGCSWNLNNGTHYDMSGASLAQHASGQKIALPATGRVEVRFWSHYAAKSAAEASKVTRSFVAHVGGGQLARVFLPADIADRNQWALVRLDISALRGAGAFSPEVRLEGKQTGTGAGWFIDDLEVVQQTLKADGGVPCAFDADCHGGDPCVSYACVKERCSQQGVADGAPCDDGDACTSATTCAKGACQAGATLTCDDGDVCTKDACDAKAGCVAEPLAEGAPCDDGVACTSDTVCTAGACLGVDPCDDGNPCTWASCESGQCKQASAPNGTPCARNATCNNGACAYPTSKPGAFSGGAATCATDGSTGELWCWGKNADGTVGDGTTTLRKTRVKVALTGKVRDVAAGDSATCAVVEDAGKRALWCWGRNVGYVAGAASEGALLVKPALVPGTADAASVCMGARHTCVLDDEGRVRCFGDGADQRLGNAFGDSSPTPRYVPGVADAVSLACARASTCARRRDGSVVCWGANDVGQLGRGVTGPGQRAPAAVKGLGVVNGLDAGRGDHVCAKVGNNLYCWGHNGHGQLGDGTTLHRSAPVFAKVYEAAARFTVGRDSTCAVNYRHSTYDTDSSKTFALQCWGHGASGQLGNGKTASLSKPATNYYVQGKKIAESNWVTGFEAATHALGDYDRTPCARTGNELYCWGYGGDGNVGNDQTSDRTLRARVHGF